MPKLQLVVGKPLMRTCACMRVCCRLVPPPQVSCSPHAVWLYHMCDVIGKPLPRSFPPMRKMTKEFPPDRMKTLPPWRLNICRPPPLGPGGALTFVTCRMTAGCGVRGPLHPRPHLGLGGGTNRTAASRQKK